MYQAVEEQVRALARPLWESAARPYGMAMDFWLMAEQMVLEVMSATAQMQSAMLSEPPPLRHESLDAAPVAQIRALAECMWDSAGRQYELTQEYWLAAERHVLAMVRAASVTNGNSPAAEIAALAPSAYLERIRDTAYFMWESTGRQYGRALEFWLAAERQMLAVLTAAYAPRPTDGTTPAPKADAASEPAPVVEPAAPLESAAVTEAAAADGSGHSEVDDAGPAPRPTANAAATAPTTAKRRKGPAAAKPRSTSAAAGIERRTGRGEAGDM